MAKRNKILIITLCCAVLALVIALCFVGNTFARFTLKQEETVSASIAEWSIGITDGDELQKEVELDSNYLKPVGTKFDGTQRISDPDDNFICVAKLTNTGDVPAGVTVKEDTDTVTATYRTMTETELAKGAAYGVTTSANTTPVYATDESGTPTEEVTGYTYTPGDDKGYADDTDTTGSQYESELADHFIAEVYYDTNGTATKTSEAKTFDDESLDEDGVTIDTGESIYIYLAVEWISDLPEYSGDTATGNYLDGDGFDTWCGLWVESFSFGVEINAVQTTVTETAEP